MTLAIDTYEQIERLGYPISPAVEKLLLEYESQIAQLLLTLEDVVNSSNGSLFDKLASIDAAKKIISRHKSK